ncbi:MAG: hypothetical protein LBU05_03125, partial [Bifidobacteriaceae bacterium]|nr:hypothetical protein [Bifidobacteriaceae bacterium]
MPVSRVVWRPWGLGIVAGLAGVVSYWAFRPAGWWWAGPVAMGLLYLALRPLGPWHGFAAASLFGLAQFLPMLTWSYNAAGFLPYLALALTSAVFLALGALGYGYSRFLVGQGRLRVGHRRGGTPVRRGRSDDRPVGRSGVRSSGRGSDGAGAGAPEAVLVRRRWAGGRRLGDQATGKGGAGLVRGRTASAARGEPSVADAVLFGLAFTAADTLRQFVPFGGFPWGRLGFSQVDGPMARWAWLGGVPLVGLATALVGPLAVVAIWAVIRRAWRPAAWSAGLAAFALLAPLALPISGQAETGTLMAGAVQGDVEVTQEGLFARQREVLENHVAVSLELAAEEGEGNLDVVFWPENSSDIDPRTDDE